MSGHNQMRLENNNSMHWDFIRRMRIHPKNIVGFIKQSAISEDQQTRYMEKYGNCYKVCVWHCMEVGYISCINNDISLAVHPDHQGRGIGKFMLREFSKEHPFATARVKAENIASMKVFFACGYEAYGYKHGMYHLRKTSHGYYVAKHNPFKIVEMFEETIADYTGANFAVAVDSGTNAIFLACQYWDTVLRLGRVTIPNKTYLSVPQSILQAGGRLQFEKLKWSGIYQLKPHPLWDATKRLTSDMYISGSLMCLSFHIKKTLPLGKGGMILTDSLKFVSWCRRARYEGRGPLDYKHDIVKDCGWNMYMTPEQAARGLSLMQNYPLHVPDLEENEGYRDLSEFELFKDVPYVKGT